MPRLTRDEILTRLRGDKPQEEIDLEQQAEALETPQFSQQEQDVAGLLGTALGSIGAATFRGLGDESRAKSFQQEAQKAGGLFAEKEAQRQALREKLQGQVAAKRKQRLEEGLTATKEDRAGREEGRKDKRLGMEQDRLGLAKKKDDRAQKGFEMEQTEFAEQRSPISGELASSLNLKLKGLGPEYAKINVSKMSRNQFADFLKTLPADKRQEMTSSLNTPATNTLLESHIAQQKRAGNPAFANITSVQDYVSKTGRMPTIADVTQERLSFGPATGTRESLIRKGTETKAEAQAGREAASSKQQEFLKMADQLDDSDLGAFDARAGGLITGLLGAEAAGFRSPEEAGRAKVRDVLSGSINAATLTEFVKPMLGTAVTEAEKTFLQGFLPDVTKAATVDDLKRQINTFFGEIKKMKEKKEREGSLIMGAAPAPTQQQAPSPDRARLERLRRLKELRAKQGGQ